MVHIYLISIVDKETKYALYTSKEIKWTYLNIHLLPIADKLIIGFYITESAYATVLT